MSLNLNYVPLGCQILVRTLLVTLWSIVTYVKEARTFFFLLQYFSIENRQKRSEVETEKNLRIQPGFEPMTFWILVIHSYQLSYWALKAAECRVQVPSGTSSNLATSLLNLDDGGTEMWCCLQLKFTAVAEALLAVLASHGLTGSWDFFQLPLGFSLACSQHLPYQVLASIMFNLVKVYIT